MATHPSFERFMDKVRTGPGCWEWTGARKKGGYGLFKEELGDKDFSRATRVAMRLLVGVDPGERLVCHHCDNPACVRPSHLFLGTPAENSRDMARKRRSTHGAKNPMARVTPEMAQAMLSAVRNGMLGQDVARQFGVSNALITLLRSGKHWTIREGLVR